MPKFRGENFSRVALKLHIQYKEEGGGPGDNATHNMQCYMKSILPGSLVLCRVQCSSTEEDLGEVRQGKLPTNCPPPPTSGTPFLHSFPPLVKHCTSQYLHGFLASLTGSP